MRQQLVGVYCTLVRLEQRLDRADNVLQAHRRGVEIGKNLLYAKASAAPYPLAQHNHSLGALHETAGRHERALLSFHESDRFLNEVLQHDPIHFHARYLQAVNGFYRGMALHGLGRREEAVASCRRAHRLSEQLVGERPDNAVPRELLAQICFWLGKLHSEAGRRSEATIAFQECAEIYGRFARQTPNEAKWRFMQGTCVHSMGNQLADRVQIAQAADYFRRAAALRENACRDAPNHHAWHADLAGTWHRLGTMEERLEHGKEALTAYRRAVEELRLSTAKTRCKAEQLGRRRAFVQDAARLLRKLGRDDEAAVPRRHPISSRLSAPGDSPAAK